ncbi:MAG: ribulose-phosphate 3-epimerase [Verrucomicrobia bacterium]|nr:ribulose-phosphate 3-epimerase [Verrucomicrobiota bacterium]
MPRPLLIAPSILAADFGQFAEEAARAEAAGGDWLHVDVMDGHFVPNLTIGPDVVRALRKATKLPLDVHLMVERPDSFAPVFVEAGADWLTIHVESQGDVAGTLRAIRASGKRPGLSFKPATPVSALEPLLGLVDLVLVMTVNPGFGGQDFIESALDKVKALAVLRDERKLDFHIEVDGGITARTVGACVRAGANAIVAGTALFRAPDMARAIAAFRGAC